ncbi:MAG: hypothetical protein U0105_18985 [Candidatus Obscuribacterales bacterium]
MRSVFRGDLVEGRYQNDIYWLHPEGREMKESDWTDRQLRTLGILIEGSGICEIDEILGPVCGHTLLILANSSHLDSPFEIPKHPLGPTWSLLVETSERVSRTTWDAELFPTKAAASLFFSSTNPWAAVSSSSRDIFRCPDAEPQVISLEVSWRTQNDITSEFQEFHMKAVSLEHLRMWVWLLSGGAVRLA